MSELTEAERETLRDWWDDTPNMSEGTMLNELDAAVEAILAARLARVEALIPKPPVLDDGMIRHDVFSHSGGLQCDLCPNWPHASCVSAYALRAALRSDAHTEQKGAEDG